jgi:hypothetical protein
LPPHSPFPIKPSTTYRLFAFTLPYGIFNFLDYRLHSWCEGSNSKDVLLYFFVYRRLKLKLPLDLENIWIDNCYIKLVVNYLFLLTIHDILGYSILIYQIQDSWYWCTFQRGNLTTDFPTKLTTQVTKKVKTIFCTYL